MDTLQRTTAALGAAERALATLASEATGESKYDVAAQLIDLAKELNTLSSRARRLLDHNGAGTASRDGRHAVKRRPQVVVQDPLGRPRKGSYPRFVRDGESLVKIGWSRTEKAEYEHKCPKRVLPLLASAIGGAGSNNKRFTVERILPLVDPVEDREVPIYQVYLGLAWFRELGLIAQHGRQGYTVIADAPIDALLELHWGQLPSR
jgi:hypothetical protein